MTTFSKWKTIGYAAALFIAGAISGGALGVYQTKSQQFAPNRPQEIGNRLRKRLQSKLDLSPDQMAKINPIIDGAASNIRRIRDDGTKNIVKVLDDSYAEISAILTPQQRVELDKMQKERHEMMQRNPEGGGRRHPGPGGGGRDGQDRDEPSPASPVPGPSVT